MYLKSVRETRVKDGLSLFRKKNYPRGIIKFLSCS
jgi:hypothetical protein